VRETRRLPRHFDFSVEVVNPGNGWAELLPEASDIVSALQMVELLKDEDAKLYCKLVRVLSSG
jgi:hypothetical protein